MDRCFPSRTCRPQAAAKLAFAFALAGAMLHGTPAFSGGKDEPVEDVRPENWQWWHHFYFYPDGRPRRETGVARGTKDHQYRLPTYPPINGPDFGYHQPCWRQMDVSPRCVTCETVPQTSTFGGSKLPPSPSETPAAAPPAVSPVPDLPPPIPAPTPIVPKPPAPALELRTTQQATSPPAADLRTPLQASLPPVAELRPLPQVPPPPALDRRTAQQTKWEYDGPPPLPANDPEIPPLPAPPRKPTVTRTASASGSSSRGASARATE